MLYIIQNFLICKTLPFLKFADTTFYLVYNTCEFWKKALEERKNKGINQEVLAQQPGTNVPANGRYERDEKKLSIDAASRRTDILGVFLDWSVGQTDLEPNKGMINRIKEVTKMKDKEKEHLFTMPDAFITSTKMQGFLAK